MTPSANEALQLAAQLLKYLGLLVATTSSVWGLTQDLRTDGTDGRKHLNRAGKVSISLTILGLVISLTAAATADRLSRIAEEADRDAKAAAALQRQGDLLDQLKRDQELIQLQIDTFSAAQKSRFEQRERFDRLTREEAVREQRAVRRQIGSTNEILLASQPLRSVRLEWTFDIPAAASESIADGQQQVEGFRDDDEAKYMDRNLFEAIASAISRREILYPWMNVVGGSKWEAAPVVALIALDREATAILPFGLVPGARSGLLESPNDLAAYRFDPSGEPLAHSPEDIREQCGLSTIVVNTKIVIVAEAAAGCLATALHTVRPTYVPSARLPSEITVIVLTKIEKLPVNVDNVTNELVHLPWKQVDPARRLPPDTSHLSIRPNGLSDQAVTYAMRRIRKQRVTLGGGQENEPEFFAEVAIFLGSRTLR